MHYNDSQLLEELGNGNEQAFRQCSLPTIRLCVSSPLNMFLTEPPRLKDSFQNPDGYMLEELSRNIEKAIGELPETYREVFSISRFGNCSNKEIADQLNVSVKTVEYRITQALKILRIKLKDYLYLLSAWL